MVCKYDKLLLKHVDSSYLLEYINWKNFMLNCSCEKVLCAIGDFILVVSEVLSGNTKKPDDVDFVLLYESQAINKYDCLIITFFILKLL